jgi:hypothetical protein
MAKLIQICASQNDLFGLDGDGVVYQYNFKTNNWMQLDHARSDREEPLRPQGRRTSAPPRPRNTAAPWLAAAFRSY